MINKRKVGADMENISSKYLQEQGFEIIKKNYRCTYGEIDIIAKKDSIIIFVEVKYRSSTMFGQPFESVNHNKIKHISKTANHFLMNNAIYANMQKRFDIISIVKKDIIWIKNAFEFDYS